MKKISTILLAFSLLTGGLFAQAPKKVLLEDFTGAWCGYCPRGLTVSNQVESLLPYVIAMGMHSGSPTDDAMATPYSNDICNFFASGYPNGGVDRTKFSGQTTVGMSTNLWLTKCIAASNVPAPLDVLISNTYNQSTRVLDITVTADFVAAVAGDLRMNCVLAEDSVTGTGAGYDQHNYMGQACSSPDPSSPWYTFPCNIIGYHHRHLARVSLAAPVDNTWGDSGIIPSSVTAGQNFTKTYSYTLPVGWNENKIEIIAFVSSYGPTDADCYVLNSNKLELGATLQGISNPSNGIPEISILGQNYPNPFSDFTTIKFNLAGSDRVVVKIYDILGKEVNTLLNAKLSGGEYNIVWDGTNANGMPVGGGLYFYQLSSGTQVFTKQMTLIRN